MSEVYYFNLSSQDNQILSPKTGVAKLKVRVYQDISLLRSAGRSAKNVRDLVFWFNREDVPNPEGLVNPGIRMSLTYFEEVTPNKFVIRDFGNREYNLELLYVE